VHRCGLATWPLRLEPNRKVALVRRVVQ
jgi:hypothetical protein